MKVFLYNETKILRKVSVYMFLFDESYKNFHMFGLSHLFAILFFIIVYILLLVFKNKITDKFDLYFRTFLASSMIFMEFIFYLWNFSKGNFDLSLLPLGLCALSMYITSLALFKKSEKVFQFIFPWAVSGALISLFIANLDYNIPHFRYFHYFYNHGFFLVANLYMLTILKFKFRYKDLLKSGLILFIYALIIYPINLLINTNHLFLRELPEEATFMFSYLGDFWVIGFMFAIGVLFHLIYIGVYLYNKKQIKG
jgi:hypothetical integral membrane protein (TIGR02206 family)